ncbi:MAG TPA: sortase [bacterium]|nr:sortase [bacterium]
MLHRPKNRKRSTVRLALALIAAGALLTFGPTLALNVWDAYLAKVRQAQTARWMTAHLKPATAVRGRRANMARAAGVIEPGRDGYLLEIPRLNLQLVVHMLEPIALTGVPTPTLSQYGLGQIPYTTVLANVSPGGNGTAAIAGHRTTHGAPFRHLDVLQPGDLIVVRKGTEMQRWRVSATAVIAPTDVDAIRSHPGARRLVLLACTPPFSAKSRLMVVAQLATPPIVEASLRATPPPASGTVAPVQDPPASAPPVIQPIRPLPAAGAAPHTVARTPLPAPPSAVSTSGSGGPTRRASSRDAARASGGNRSTGAARANNTYRAAGPRGRTGSSNAGNGAALNTGSGSYASGGDVLWSPSDRQHERDDSGGGGDRQHGRR